MITPEFEKAFLQVVKISEAPPTKKHVELIDFMRETDEGSDDEDENKLFKSYISKANELGLEDGDLLTCFLNLALEVSEHLDDE